jgi:hypothetical protein
VAAFAAAIVVSAIAASSASAILKTLPNGQTVSYQPLRGAASPSGFDTAFNNVDYNGGPVMPSNTDYIVFWSPTGAGAYGSSEYMDGLDQYFKDLAHDSGGHQNVDSVAAQYNDSTGHSASYHVSFGGGILDTDPYPASQCPVNSPVTNCLTDLQMQKELEHFAAAHHFKTDLSHEYFLMTPPHVENCGSSNSSTGFDGCSAGEMPQSLAAYCAYHSNTTLP